MSTRYVGGIVTKAPPPVPTGPSETGRAPGVWTLEQAMQYKKAGVWPTQGV